MLLYISPAAVPCFSLNILKLVWSLENFNTMLLTFLPNFWMTQRIDKYGYRGVYSRTTIDAIILPKLPA